MEGGGRRGRGWRKRGEKLCKDGKEAKEDNGVRASLLDGRRETRGWKWEVRGREGERPSPCSNPQRDSFFDLIRGWRPV